MNSEILHLHLHKNTKQLYFLLLLIPSIVFVVVLLLLSKQPLSSQQAAVDQVPTVLGTESQK